MDRLEVWKWALMPLGFIVQSAVNSGQDKHNHSTVIHLLAVCSGDSLRHNINKRSFEERSQQRSPFVYRLCYYEKSLSQVPHT